jgi:hypothetical protein
MDSTEHENSFKGRGLLMTVLRKEILRKKRNGFGGSDSPWKQQQVSPVVQCKVFQSFKIES